MAVPGPANPRLAGIPPAALSEIANIVQSQVAAKGGPGTEAFLAASAKAYAVLRTYQVPGATRAAAAAAVQFTYQRNSAADQYTAELADGGPEAIVPTNPNLQPAEVNIWAEVQIRLPGDAEPTTFRLGYRGTTLPQT